MDELGKIRRLAVALQVAAHTEGLARFDPKTSARDQEKLAQRTEHAFEDLMLAAAALSQVEQGKEEG